MLSEYINNDGSGLIGALNPSGVGQALLVDGSGNLKIAGSITSSSASTGTNGSAIPTSSTLIGGSDGTNLHPLIVDGSNFLKVNVAAGSISASNASIGTNGAATPTSSTLIGGSDGVNLQAGLVESSSNPNIRAAIYSAGNKLAIDSSGRLTLIPNSSVNIAQITGVAPQMDGGSSNRIGVSLYGKNAAAGDTALLLDASGNVQSKLVAGSALAGGVNVVDSAGTNKLSVDSSGRITSIVQAVAGTALAADQSNTELRASIYGKSSTAGDTAVGVDASGRLTSIIQVVGGTALAADQTNSIIRTSLYVKKSAAGDTVLALGSATSANSMPVVIASDQGAIPITQPTSATGTITSVAGANTSTSLLASNANRKGAYFFNESTATLYLALAGSAATNAYTVQIPGNGFFEIPATPVYTGAVFGVWSSAAGSCRITEMS